MTAPSTEYTELAPDLVISRVLAAWWPMAGFQVNDTDTHEVVAANGLISHLDAGLTSFDIADDDETTAVFAKLTRSEAAPHPKVQLLSHWIPKRGKLNRQEVRDAIEQSLDRLNRDRLDLLQFHAVNYTDPIWLDSLSWLQEIREEGLIGHLGLCHFDAPHLGIALASGIRILTNQVHCPLFDQRAAVEMRDVCEQYGVRLLAHGTTAGGFISQNWLGKPEPDMGLLTGSLQQNYKHLLALCGGWSGFQQLLSVLGQLADKHGVPISAVSSRYVLDQPGVAGVIRSVAPGHGDPAKEFASILAAGLDQDDRDLIQQALPGSDADPIDKAKARTRHPLLAAAHDSNRHLYSGAPVYPVQKKENGKTYVLSGAVWEGHAGYCRATRSGRRILVSGTTAVHGDRLIGGKDPAAQTHFVIDKIQAAIESLGGKLEDVDRTRIYVNDIRHWEQVTGAHGERFGHIQPVTTLVQAKLIGEEYLVEIEAEARVV